MFCYPISSLHKSQLYRQRTSCVVILIFSKLFKQLIKVPNTTGPFPNRKTASLMTTASFLMQWSTVCFVNLVVPSSWVSPFGQIFLSVRERYMFLSCEYVLKHRCQQHWCNKRQVNNFRFSRLPQKETNLYSFHSAKTVEFSPQYKATFGVIVRANKLKFNLLHCNYLICIYILNNEAVPVRQGKRNVINSYYFWRALPEIRHR